MLLVAAFGGILWFYAALVLPDNLTSIVVACGWVGCFMTPILPAALENAAECTYPVHEDVGLSLMMNTGQHSRRWLRMR